MNRILGFVAALLLVTLSALPASAQNRTVRHPATGTPALSVIIPSDWTTQVDADNNLIIASSSRTAAFSLTLVQEPASYTLDAFAREALGYAEATNVSLMGAGALGEVSGNTYTANMATNGQTLDLKMIITKFGDNWYASATMITGAQTTAGEAAAAQTVLNSVRVLR